MKNKIINDGIAYIGADDKELDLFEGQYAIPDGISYNSYVIIDEKVAVLDTIDARKTNEWLENLAAALDGRTPDYLVVHHMEPDHSANVRRMIETYPDITVVCSMQASKMLDRFFGLELPASRLRVVKEGDTLELGAHTLQFIAAPMVHWPEVIMSYEQKEGILFSADGFGKFGALGDNLMVEKDDWACEARRYYFNIVGKYGVQVNNVLKKAAALDIHMICPLHGPMLDSDLNYYVTLYDTWSSYRPESEGVFIAYCSMHGNTEEAALKLASILKSETSLKVSLSDLRRDDMAEAVEDAFRYDRMVVAAPTYEADIMPCMRDFLEHLRSKGYQRRKVGIIENSTWAPMAGKRMKEFFEGLREIELVEPMVSIETTVKPQTIEKLKLLAEALSE